MTSSLRATLEETAETLAARPVLVRFTQPPTRGALGETYLDPSGLVLIDLAPGLPAAKMFDIYLHELAHALLHIAHVAPTPEARQRPGAITQPPAAHDPAWLKAILERRELEAEALAGIWRTWAEQQACKYLSPSTPPELRAALLATILKFWSV